MRPKTPIPSTARRLGLCAAAAGLAFAAAPAFAQPAYAPDYSYAPTLDELTIQGRLGPNGPNSLSRAVDISDLDLRYDRDVREMQRRVRTTARQICDELGEHGGPGVTPSCEDAAVRSAQRQSRFAIAQARSTTFYAYNAPAYVAPYAGQYAPPASVVVPYDEPPPL
jgi:UrcA family protein